MKKNGFISTSLIYTFFILFLLLMLLLLNSYSSKRFLLERYKNEIRNSFVEDSIGDINLYIMAYNEITGEYEVVDEVPSGYYYEEDYSDCNRGDIKYKNNNIFVSTSGKDTCYARFKKYNIKINYYLQTSNGGYEMVVEVPKVGYSYNSAQSWCVYGSTVKVSDDNIVTVEAASAFDECELFFDLDTSDIIVQALVWNETERKYKISEVPSSGYEIVQSNCTDVATISYDGNTGSLNVNSIGPTVCTVYFKKGV